MEQGLSGGERDALLRVARASIRDVLFADGSLPEALTEAEAFPALAALGACFVTLKCSDAAGESGEPRLRGCIGTLAAREPLFRSVASNARQAAFHDPRFPALAAVEFPRVTLSISVLGNPTPIAGPEEIVIGRDGVILEKGSFRSVFLPEVAVEQGWDRETLLAYLARKAGLPRDGWHGARLLTFRTESFGPRGEEDEKGTDKV